MHNIFIIFNIDNAFDLNSFFDFQSTINKCVHCLYQSNNEVNKVLEKRFYSYIRILINDLEKCDPDLIDTEKSTEWVKLNVLYIFYIKLFKVNDKKFFKILKGVNKKVYIVIFD